MTIHAPAGVTSLGGYVTSMPELDIAAQTMGHQGFGLAPVQDVRWKKSTVAVLPREVLLRNAETARNYDGTFNKVQGNWEELPYACQNHGIEWPVDMDMEAATEEFINQRMAAIQITREIIVRAHTKRVYTAAVAASSATGTSTGVISVHGTFDPFKEIDGARTTIRNATGMVANALLLDWEAWLHLRANDAIRNAIRNSNVPDRDFLNPSVESVATVLDLQHIFVQRSVENTANMFATPSYAGVWDRTQMIVFVRSTAPLESAPSFMKTFHWPRNKSRIGANVEEYYNPAADSNMVRARMDTDELVCDAALGHRITGILA